MNMTRLGWMLPGLLTFSLAASLCHADSVCHPLLMERECRDYLQRIRDAASVDEAMRIEARHRVLIDERQRLCPIRTWDQKRLGTLLLVGAETPPAIKAPIRY